MMDETRRVFGIDLGTTYSCVAQVDEHDKAVVLKNFEGKDITPSAVYFSGANEVLVGEPAKENSKLEPDKTVTFIKRQMSRDDAFEKPTKFPNGLTPTEISAYILRKIVQDANDSGQYSEPIKKVVITCPAYFGEKERLRTRQAGEIAGLEVLAIINEPTAAAIAYGQEKREGEKNVLVYDLGGGTFDVTLIKVSGGNITVIATDGNSGLGGYDWDRELAKYLLSEYNRKKGTSYELKEGTALFNEMMLLAEEQKKRLSVRNRDKNSPVTALATIKGETAKIDITRAAFDAMTSMLLDETIEKTHEVLGIGKEKGFTRLDEVLLVGGSCRMLQIEEKINTEFNCKSKLNDPDCCVAKGAAILALNKSFTIESEKYDTGESDIKPRGLTPNTRINATNVTSKNYGLGITDRNTGRDLVQNLIPANTPLNGNCRGEDTFAVPKDGLAFLNFPIYESDNRTKELYDVEMATLLEQHSLALPEGIKQDDPAKVVFEIDTEGFLHVHGDVLGSIIEFEIKLKGVMNEQELKEAKLRVGKAKVE